MQLPAFDYEKKYWSEGAKIVVGIDEAGRGPLAGPVVAGAVAVFPEIVEKMAKNPECRLIRDSKTLSALQREKAYDLIAQNLFFGTGWSDHAAIDRINILQASFLAMKKAISALRSKLEGDIEMVLVDGRSPIPNTTMRQKNIISGDKFVFSISAASIIAKVTRDRMMIEFHKKFPHYGFKRHKGYGTRLHFEMLEKFGPCEIHRKSFRLRKKNNKRP